MLIAAAFEFRRAHQFWSDEFQGRWSHGDASSTNVIYDASNNRARLIDFEIYHEKSLARPLGKRTTCSFSCSIWLELCRPDNGCRSRPRFWKRMAMRK